MRISTVWTNGNRSWRRRLAAAALATSALLAIGGGSSAGARELPAQRNDERDRSEIMRDRWNRRDDWRDLRQFERLLDRLEGAERNGDWGAEQRARDRIYQLIRRELAEARRDAWSDRGEARENWGDRADGRDTRGEGWGDSRDGQAGRWQARGSRWRLERERSIAAELRGMQREIRRGTPRALARERALLNEFLRIERQDARASGRELREDRRGVGGDRQDSWDDRQDQPNSQDQDRGRAEPGEDAEPF